MAKLRDIAPFSLRMGDSLRTRLEAAAKESGRSLNAEILHRLEIGISADKLAHFTDGDLLQELLSRYGRDGIEVRIHKKD